LIGLKRVQDVRLNQHRYKVRFGASLTMASRNSLILSLSRSLINESFISKSLVSCFEET